MPQDVRSRVDQFFAAPKRLVGPWAWYRSERVNTMKFKREIAEDGELHGFRLEVDAFLATPEREFRYLVIGQGRCVCRLDCAPTIDRTHINGPKRPAGFPFAVDCPHYHPWPENRGFSTGTSISDRLPYALDSPSRIATIQQGFWVFCGLIGLSATSADEPEWPTRESLL